MFVQTALAAAVGLASTVNAGFFRVDPSTLVQERTDPIVSAGKISGHVHVIAGGSAFDNSLTYDKTQTSQCTTTDIKEDKSNYWTPMVYFKYKDGSVIAPSPPQQGLSVYYSYDENAEMRAFPKEFRMVAGFQAAREQWQPLNAEQWVYFECLGANTGKLLTGFPKQACKDGVRANIHFPTCGAVDESGNLVPDSENHRDHVVYPIDGVCPPTHPARYPELHYELWWSNTGNGVPEWSEGADTEQPFMLANGDHTGYGFHGDFFNGWEGDILQRALTECTKGGSDGTVSTCLDVFTKNTREEKEDCKKTRWERMSEYITVQEDIRAHLPKLPGCNSQVSSTNNALVASTGTCNEETGEITLPDGSIFDPNGTYDAQPNGVPVGADQHQDKKASESAYSLEGHQATKTGTAKIRARTALAAEFVITAAPVARHRTGRKKLMLH